MRVTPHMLRVLVVIWTYNMLTKDTSLNQQCCRVQVKLSVVIIIVITISIIKRRWKTWNTFRKYGMQWAWTDETTWTTYAWAERYKPL